MATFDPLARAEIRILDGHVVLIHIPLHLHEDFRNPIFHLASPTSGDGEPFVPDPYPYGFVSVSLTSVECSVICPRDVCEKYFVTTRRRLGTQGKEVVISEEDYLVVMVGGIGYEAAERIAELTAPLAQEGVPIFFISTHACDYIVAPESARDKIIACFEKRGFAYSTTTGNYLNTGSNPPTRRKGSEPISPYQVTAPMDIRRPGSSKFPTPDFRKPQPLHSIYAQPRGRGSEADDNPLNVLKRRTFQLIKEHDITPIVEPNLYLLQAGAISDRSTCAGVLKYSQRLPEPRGVLLFKAIALNLAPDPASLRVTKFFSVCLTASDPASFWIESHTLKEWDIPYMPGSLSPSQPPPEPQKSLVSCDPKQVFLPMTLDLRGLSGEMETLTGFVCGIVATLVDANIGGEDRPLAYLSTAMASTVCIAMAEYGQAVQAVRSQMGPAY